MQEGSFSLMQMAEISAALYIVQNSKQQCKLLYFLLDALLGIDLYRDLYL
jgi:acetyl-CoA carboxylase beta subunit